MMKKKNILIGVSCLFILIAGVCYSCAFNNKKDKTSVVLSSGLKDAVTKEEEDISNKEMGQSLVTGEEMQEGAFVETQSLVYIHLCGAVAKPDVYEVKHGSRLIDIIELAGGLSPDAAGDYINQAMLVEDGQRIYIPTKDEVARLSVSEYLEGSEEAENQAKETEKKVNINEADADELMALPGIGQAKADSIIEYRNKNGQFQSKEDLMRIPGIKEGLYNQLADHISVK